MTTAQGAKHKPCPFCGGRNLGTPIQVPVVVCGDCEAAGPMGRGHPTSHELTELAAFAKWDERHAIDSARPAGSDKAARWLVWWSWADGSMASETHKTFGEAEADAKSKRETGGYNIVSDPIPLYTHPLSLQAKREALEDAAKMCDKMGDAGAGDHGPGMAYSIATELRRMAESLAGDGTEGETNV